MARGGEIDVKGPLYTEIGPQGGLGGEDVHDPEPMAIHAPDPLKLVNVKGVSSKKSKD